MLTWSELMGILDNQDVKMIMETAQQTKVLAEKVQASVDKMEKMTAHMQRVAANTEQETVSMRIVTYVTLFFLPGTFVSVSSCHSHMGTDGPMTDFSTDDHEH